MSASTTFMPSAGEPLAQRPADPTATAGDDGDLAPQVLHGSTVTLVDRYIVISADCHAGADLLDYRPYLESRYHDDFDAWAASFVSPYGDLVRPDADRNWDSTRRMRELEADGVVGEIIYPNTIPPFYARGSLVATAPSAEDFELRLAGLRAHNRWLAEWCGEFPARRAGIGQILLNDVDEAVRDVHWIADHDLRGGVLLPGVPPGSPIPPLHARVRPGVARVRGARGHRERARRQQLPRLRRAPRVAVDVAHGDGVVLPPPAVDVHPGRGRSTGSPPSGSCSPSRAAAGSATRST